MLTMALIVSALANVFLLYRFRKRAAPQAAEKRNEVGMYEYRPTGAVLVGPPLGRWEPTREDLFARYEREGIEIPFGEWVAQQKMVRA